MASETEKYQELKDKIQQIQRRRDQAQGALHEAERVLAERFKCADLTAAKKLLKKMKSEIETQQEKLEQLESEFEEEYQKFMESES